MRRWGITKLGTQILLLDGSEWTVVFNSLTGVGVKEGLHDPDPRDFENTHGSLFSDEKIPDKFPWIPDAMLRDKSLEASLGMRCIGEEEDVVESITRYGLGEQ